MSLTTNKEKSKAINYTSQDKKFRVTGCINCPHNETIYKKTGSSYQAIAAYFCGRKYRVWQQPNDKQPLPSWCHLSDYNAELQDILGKETPGL